MVPHGAGVLATRIMVEIIGEKGENMGFLKSWEKHGKNMGNDGKIMGRLWENHGNIMGKSWENHWKMKVSCGVNMI